MIVFLHPTLKNKNIPETFRTSPIIDRRSGESEGRRAARQRDSGTSNSGRNWGRRWNGGAAAAPHKPVRPASYVSTFLARGLVRTASRFVSGGSLLRDFQNANGLTRLCRIWTNPVIEVYTRRYRVKATLGLMKNNCFNSVLPWQGFTASNDNFSIHFSVLICICHREILYHN